MVNKVYLFKRTDRRKRRMFYENKRNARESIVVDYCDNLGQRFVAQSVSMDYVGPFTFQAVRNLLGALALLPVILLSDRKKKKEGKMPMSRAEKKQLWIGGLVCGAVLGLAGWSAADWCTAYNGGESGFYYGAVYSDRAGFGSVVS